MKRGIDLVISGCDFSGTSTQIAGIMDYLKSQGKVVRDLRGSETDAMFHAHSIMPYNKVHSSLNEFLNDPRVHPLIIQAVLNDINKLTRKNGFGISSMVENDVSEYINPWSADA